MFLDDFLATLANVSWLFFFMLLSFFRSMFVALCLFLPTKFGSSHYCLNPNVFLSERVNNSSHLVIGKFVNLFVVSFYCGAITLFSLHLGLNIIIRRHNTETIKLSTSVKASVAASLNRSFDLFTSVGCLQPFRRSIYHQRKCFGGGITHFVQMWTRKLVQ